MPQIVNTFLKSKMNKDLDSRILPNGEYRDAQNLQISKSEGAEVGEFENIPGNTRLTYLYTGRNGTDYTGKIIGQYTDETNNNIYIMSAGYSGAGRCPRDLLVYADPAGVTNQTQIQIFDAAGNVLDPAVVGVQLGMVLWGDSWNSLPSAEGGQGVDPIVTNINIATDVITLSQAVSFTNNGGVAPGDIINIGFNNTIHRYNIDTDTTTLLVRGAFLNFHQDFRIHGINLIENLLFWTDNRNQPRKINVENANPTSLISPTHYLNEDQISVAKYYPYETPLVLHQLIRTVDSGGYVTQYKAYSLRFPINTDLNKVQIGDIVTGFPSQGYNELWNVILVNRTIGSEEVVIYNNFKTGDPATSQQPGTYNGTDNIPLTFSNTTMKNSSESKLARGFTSTVSTAAGPIAVGNPITIVYDFNNTNSEQTPQPTPRVGDYITSNTLEITGTGAGAITLADEVIISEITTITPGTSIVLELTKGVTIAAGTNDITISPNPNYNSNFTGDPDLIEEKFVRFSYRFKYEDNEYSLAAPYTQICFIPKHDGYFGGGKPEQLQDMLNTYDSTIVEWFTNKIDTISLKVPLPDGGTTASAAVTNLIDGYKVTDIEILYKESDAISVKILETIPVTNSIVSLIEEIPNDAQLTTSVPNGPQWYYNFDYKSIKPYRTLPTSEQNRVYDNVPVKALGQEISANRVIYGNFLQGYTPPISLDYEVTQNDKSLQYNNYAQYPNHSIKQNRNYQVGFVLADRYGRSSSVVLSSNDTSDTKNGSTIYVPYKSWSDVGGPNSAITTGISPDATTIYKWLGSVLRVKLNNGITQITNNSVTGEPGLYKSQDDTSVDGLILTGGGAGHAVGDVITTGYPAGNLAYGTGLTYKVVTETGGVITGIEIVTPGTGYATGQLLFQTGTTGGGTGAVVTTIVNDPNPTGWQSYKLVVKQQEQEYYNVYLPGFISGYPVINSSDYGRVAFAVLLGDNINKVPRDLNEVGPLQDEFSASVNLFGRVNNPNIDNKNKSGAGNYYNNRTYPWNTQYFPSRVNDEAVTVGTIGASGLQLGNSPFAASVGPGAFDNTTGSEAIPWGRTGVYQSLYNQEQAPIAMGLKIGAEESQPQLTQATAPQLNTLGAKVTINTWGVPGGVPMGAVDGCMTPFLSVSETEPVESQLEIFYESSTSGNFVTLNTQVVNEYAGVSGTTVTTGSFAENAANPSNIITSFSFTDSAGNQLTLDSVPTITQVIDGNGIDVTGVFTIRSTGGGASLVDFDIQTNQLFWYGAETGSKSNEFQISFETSYNSGAFIDTLNNQITISLTNIAPTIGGFTPSVGPDAATEKTCGGTSIGYDTTTSGSFGQFTNGVNGSADVTNNTEELCYTLTTISSPVGSTALFSIDSTTGVVTLDSGITVNGDYEFQATLTDATNPICTPSVGSLTTTCNYTVTLGTPQTNRAICFGQVDSWYGSNDTSCLSGTGLPLEVFFGVSQSVSNGTTLGSKTDGFLSTLPGSAGSGTNSYNTTSGGGINLRYYNVKARALAYYIAPTYCFPGPAPAFTTGSLTQGVMTMVVKLTKIATASAADFNTNFTILYRASSTDAWQLATDSSSVVVGNFVQLQVFGSGGSTDSATYQFNTPGEYAFRNNGVRGPGCTSFAGDATVKVEFFDSGVGATLVPCTACTGTL